MTENDLIFSYEGSLGYDAIIHKDRENHKYIAKVNIGNGIWRYFYDQEEYNKYLNKENKNEKDSSDIEAETALNSSSDTLFDKEFKNTNINTGEQRTYVKEGTLSKTIENGTNTVKKLLGINDSTEIEEKDTIYIK